MAQTGARLTLSIKLPLTAPGLCYCPAFRPPTAISFLRLIEAVTLPSAPDLLDTLAARPPSIVLERQSLPIMISSHGLTINVPLRRNNRNDASAMSCDVYPSIDVCRG
jgi:hypothetical protein